MLHQVCGITDLVVHQLSTPMSSILAQLFEATCTFDG
jgi:hypothetical protein